MLKTVSLRDFAVKQNRGNPVNDEVIHQRRKAL